MKSHMPTWVVTGANRGIGLALAREITGRGHSVVGTARRPERAGELRGTGARVEQLDVTDESSVADFARRLGGAAVDFLVHNAGVGSAGPAADRLDPAEVLRTLDVNAVGPVRVTQAILDNVRAGSRRTIVGMSSGLGSLSRNDSGGWVAYRISKAALNMYVRTLAVELAREGFTCMLLDPGWVRTDMGGPNGPTSPEDAARMVVNRIERLTPSDTGRFLDRRGRDVPW
jgi:NAD(P)-dependent dehydrogenase (short-subunit alcohol dehydrogenase family)